MGKNGKKKRRRKKQNKESKQIILQNRQFLPVLEKIQGGTFNEEWTIEKLQEAIDKIPPRKEKLRILFVGEASFLHTGFSHYWHNILPRLHATGKFEIFELGCVPDPYAKIQMADGSQKPICMIEIGDKVLTHTGNIQKVTNTFKKDVEKTLVKISRQIFAGQTLEVTDNHPVLVIKKENAYKGTRSFNHDADCEWVRADEISVGDFVAYANESFDVQPIEYIESNGIKIPLNDDAALLFGWFLADGCVLKNKKLGVNAITLCSNIKENIIINKLCDCFENLFKIRPSIIQREEIGVSEIKIYNRQIARFFYTLFGLSAHDKFITHKLWNAHRGWVTKFLAAYFEGDGCINEPRNVLCAKTVSKQLSDDIMRIANNHNIIIKRQKRKSDKNSSGGYYLLEAAGQYGQILIDKFLQKCGKLKPLGATEYLNKGHLLFTKVTQIHKRKYYGPVYNFEVEEDDSYICNNFVVHNSYAQSSDPKAKELPWKFYGVMPEKNNPQMCFEYGRPDGTPEERERYRENQFGKYIFDPVLADCRPDIVCTPPGNQVLTDKGYVPIEEVAEKTNVLTHKNRFQPIQKTFKRYYKGKLRKIYFNGCFEPLTLTPNHPVLIYKKQKQTARKKSMAAIYKDQQPQFVPADQVKNGDLIILPSLPTEEVTNSTVAMSKFLNNYVKKNNLIYPSPYRITDNGISDIIEINPNFARLLGYIVGDGSIQSRTISITFDAHQENFADDVINIAKELKLEGKKIYSDDKHCWTVLLHSVLFSKFLSKWLKSKIPSEIINADKTIKQQFLCGLIRADGCYKANTISLTTIDKRLAYTVRALYASIGICASVSKKTQPTISYDVNIYGVQQVKTVHNFVQKYDNHPHEPKLNCKKSPRRMQHINGHFVASVSRNRTTDYEGLVYNIEVKNDNSYVLQSCVHNCDIRDHWMTYWQKNSVFRENFHWMWMACVDSYPQQWEWLNDFSQTDTLLAYSFFGKRVLEEQSRCAIAQNVGLKPLDVKMVCQPGIDTEIYKPISKDEARKNFNVPKEFRFVGTVMRNQKRKLYPRLIESFRMFKEQNGWKEADPRKRRIKDIDNIKLLLHTSVQDVGFNIPEAVRREGLQTEVYYSYLCYKCGLSAISVMRGAVLNCPRCNNRSFITPNTRIGLPDKEFSKVFNLLDVYVQTSIAEGDGMPIQNAKSCGIPVIMSDYAALSEKARNGGGMYIKGDLETESETMQWRHWFDRQDFVDKLTKLFKRPGLIQRMGGEARRCIEEYYNWDFIAKKWEYILDSAKVKPRDKTWNKEVPEATPVTQEKLHKAKDLSDEEFINKCYKDILGRDPDECGKKDWLEGLQKGQPREQVEKYFRSLVGKKNRQAQLLDGEKGKVANPIHHMQQTMDKNDKFRILYCMPQTAGDVLISTAIINKLQEKYPYASIYVATEKRYFGILKDNPHVKNVFEYNGALENYRTSEPFGPSRGFVDLCFCPYIVTQRIPHWIHGGKGESLGVTYAHLCNLTMKDEEIQERMFIGKEEIQGLPEKYVTFHLQSTQDPKNYDFWDQVFERVKGLPLIQVGERDEPLLEHPDVIDMRGKTNEQQLAYVIDNSELHIGVDSFPAHVANALGKRSVIVYGGTYAKQGGILNSDIIEPPQRGPCKTSCHLIKCEIKKKGGEKCINHIAPGVIVEKIEKNIGSEYIVPEKPLKISAYCIIKNGYKFEFPYVNCIQAALKIVDEFVMVDGGSTDGTWEHLQQMAEQDQRIRVMQHEWDMNDPMLMGYEKTYARQQCTGDYLIQLDADEIIEEQQEGQIRKLIKSNPKVELFDTPVINFYGDDYTVRIDESIWKWRISKNVQHIIHGVHGGARELDPETMQIIFDKRVSDGCEYIHANTLDIIKPATIVPPECHQLHAYITKLRMEGKEIPEKLLEDYKTMFTQIATTMPLVWHYSWRNLDDKEKRGEFWEATWHGKREATHNTKKDIKNRIENKKELTVKIDVPHPLKKELS